MWRKCGKAKLEMTILIIINKTKSDKVKTNQVAGCSLQITAATTSVIPVVSNQEQRTNWLRFCPHTLRRGPTITMTYPIYGAN